MDNTKEYKVLEDVEIEGESYSKGSTVSLNDETAKDFVSDGKIEAAGDDE